MAESRSSLPRRGGAARILLIGAAVLYAAILLLGPLVALVWGAFSEGLGAAVRQISSPAALHALRLTLLLAVGATAINTVFGLCAAWVFARDRFTGRRLLNGLVDLPFAVSPVIAGLMVVLLFGRTGWLRGLSDALGVKVLFAFPGMLLATTFVSLPFVIREVTPVLEQIGTEPEKTAYTLGASPWKTFWRVTLPAARWGVLYGISLTFARALGEFGAVLVVSGSVSGLTETSTLFVFRALDERNAVGAYAMAIVLALFSSGLLAAMEIFKKRRAR